MLLSAFSVVLFMLHSARSQEKPGAVDVQLVTNDAAQRQEARLPSESRPNFRTPPQPDVEEAFPYKATYSLYADRHFERTTITDGVGWIS